MIIEFETGEKIYTEISGISEDCDIKLETHLFSLKSTYITLVSTSQFKIHNRSNIVANYEWKMFQNDTDEKIAIRQRKLMLEAEQETAISIFKKVI